MKMLKKLFCIFVLFLLFPSVLADGMIIIPDEPPLPERQQLAAINYEDGMEKMILTIGIDEVHVENAAWIFPVPADPSRVVIDIVTRFPVLRGRDIIQDAKNTINRVIENVLMTQLYPILFSRRFMSKGVVLEREVMATALPEGYAGDVVVYESIEKEGLTTQIVGARTGLGLYNYFRNKNIYVDPDSISVFDYYSGKDYTFIVSWISSKEEFEEENEGFIPPYHRFGRQIGVEVMFPTDKIYYPLLPTSVYGSLKVPATIYVLDYVRPELYDGIKSFSDVNYYKSYGRYYPERELEAFFGDNFGEKYTKIDINVPSKYFTEDLWMELGAPASVGYADFVSGKRTLLTWLLIPILSVLVGGLVGFVLFRNWKKFALVGLANCLSLIGLIIVVIFVRTKKVDENLKNKIKEAGMFVVGRDFGKKIGFVVLFSVVFVVLSYVVRYLLKAPF